MISSVCSVALLVEMFPDFSSVSCPVRLTSAGLRHLAKTAKSFRSFSSVSCPVRVFSVENLWRSLWERRWENCGKVSTGWSEYGFSTQKVEKGEVLHVMVEKFCKSFPRRKFSVIGRFYTFSTSSTITTTYL